MRYRVPLPPYSVACLHTDLLTTPLRVTKLEEVKSALLSAYTLTTHTHTSHTCKAPALSLFGRTPTHSSSDTRRRPSTPFQRRQSETPRPREREATQKERNLSLLLSLPLTGDRHVAVITRGKLCSFSLLCRSFSLPSSHSR